MTININLEEIGSIANIITALGTFTLAIAAWCALHTWHKEFIGKRKIELAGEIVMTVFEFQGLLTQARTGLYTPQEIDEIKRWLEEINRNKKDIPNSMLWPIYPEKMFCLLPMHRFNKNTEVIDKFSTILEKSLIYFGEDLYRLLVELHSFLGKIRQASEMLYENMNNIELQKIILIQDGKDDLTKRIYAIGDEIKMNLEPLYQDQRFKWKKAKK